MQDLGLESMLSEISDQFPSVDWVRVLGRYARRINPLLGELLRPMDYYWVTAQAEYSTDILFRKRADLQDLVPRLLEYSTLYFGAKEVMSFLGAEAGRPIPRRSGHRPRRE